MTVKIVLSLAYLAIVFYLGYKGWRETRVATDYMLAGRRMNPFIMAMSYGATFISTSAIIGFGGAAGVYGFPLLWLAFLNVALGVFAAMVIFGKRTRRLGLALDSHTFPELLGRRFDSPFIQGFSGLVIFIFIPVYAAAVLIGVSRLLEVSLNLPYGRALVIFTVILAVYVISGGLKAVMYTDAFQGSIMALMMLVLIIFTYAKLGGIVEAHQALTDMASLVPQNLAREGLIGWTQGARFGSPLWLTVYTTLIYGVGVGVLAQPQLTVRYMTVKSDRELNRAVLFGGLFILLMTGVAFVVGSLSNAVFQQALGQVSIAAAGGNIDKIIPIYIERIMPGWFAVLFLVAMFAAAMSTLSSQYHIGGTSLGRDFYEQALAASAPERSVRVTRLGVSLTIILTLIWAWILPPSVVARATAFFFGLCAATFLPVYLFGLYWRGLTRPAAIWSMVGGFSASMTWLLFVHHKEAAALGLCRLLTGQETLVSAARPGSFAWLLQYVDPNIFALPFSFALAVLVSLATPKMDQQHLQRCWRNYI